MQLINFDDCKKISGGVIAIEGCYTVEQWTSLHKDAWEHAQFSGALFGVAAAALTGVVLSNAPPLSATVAASFVGLGVYTYVFQDTYQSYELWPWNY